MVIHACNTSSWEAETGASRVLGQPGLHTETVSKNKISYTQPDMTENNDNDKNDHCTEKTQEFTAGWGIRDGLVRR
jgi:chitodextrinase